MFNTEFLMFFSNWVLQFCNLCIHICCYCCYWVSHVWRKDTRTSNSESTEGFICFKSRYVKHGNYHPLAYLVFELSFLFFICPSFYFQVVIPITKYPFMSSWPISDNQLIKFIGFYIMFLLSMSYVLFCFILNSMQICSCDTRISWEHRRIDSSMVSEW